MVVKMNEYDIEIKNMRDYTYQWNPENYSDPTKPILKISKSSLGCFTWCPIKYQYQYIEKRPQDTTEAMLKGTIMHNAREKFFEDFDINKAESMPREEVIDYCSSLFEIDDYFEDNLTVAMFEANRFLECREENRLEDFLPVLNEQKLDCEITILSDINPKFPLSRNYVVRLQGIIDRVFLENGGYIPMEFKTGGWKDSKATSMRKEMAFYQLMIENSTPTVLRNAGLEPNTPVTHWAWFYPIANHFHCEPIKRVSKTSVLKSIAKLIHAYENNQFPADFYFKKCKSCSYFPICDGAINDSWV